MYYNFKIYLKIYKLDVIKYGYIILFNFILIKNI